MVNIGVELKGVSARTITISDVKVGATPEQLVAALEARGLLAASELAGLQRRTIISLARRFTPKVLDFEQAVTELERAVEVAIDVVNRGDGPTSDDALVNTVLAGVAEKVRNDDFDGGANAIDDGLAELEARHRQSMITLLEEGVKVDVLRRDAVAAARRIEMIVAAGVLTDRAPWLPEYRVRYLSLSEEGETKGFTIYLLVALELVRKMLATARDSGERGIAQNLFGSTLRRLGNYEFGPEHLTEALSHFQLASEEFSREREPLSWAFAKSNLGRDSWGDWGARIPNLPSRGSGHSFQRSPHRRPARAQSIRMGGAPVKLRERVGNAGGTPE